MARSRTAGVRTNVRISLEYLAAWVGGAGAVAIDNLMEDAATVEISRMQVWHWLHHRVRTADGTEVTEDLVRQILAEVVATLAAGFAETAQPRLDAARQIFEATCLVPDWPQFFTGYAYEQFLTQGPDLASRTAGHRMSTGADGRTSLTRDRGRDPRGRPAASTPSRSPST